VVWKIFGPSKVGVVTGGWRKRHNSFIIYTSPKNEMVGEGVMGQMRHAYRILQETTRKILEVDGRIIWK
jgi:hypothetical protein